MSSVLGQPMPPLGGDPGDEKQKELSLRPPTPAAPPQPQMRAFGDVTATRQAI
jgi:hypothetical protein